MVKNANNTQYSYGFPQPLSPMLLPPVVAKRDPTVADVGYPVGQQWVNEALGNFFALSSNAGGISTWNILGTVSSTFVNLSATNFITTTAATSCEFTSNNLVAIGTNGNISINITPKGNGQLVVASSVTTLGGNLTVGSAGYGLQIKGGANNRIGTATLVAGTSGAIANTTVTANSKIFVTRSAQNASTALGELTTGINPGNFIVIYALDPANPAIPLAADASSVDYLIVESV